MPRLDELESNAREYTSSTAAADGLEVKENDIWSEFIGVGIILVIGGGISMRRL